MKPSKPMEFHVPVQDKEGKFLLPTSPANARKLLKEEKARVQSKNPFSISLNKNVEVPNTQRRLNMRTNNMHEFFREPKALYVQNVTNPIGNVSLEFRDQSGLIIPVKIPSTRNPIILTDHVTFEIVKQSAEFLKYLKPTVTSGAKLQLLTEDEFQAYYEQRAKELEASSIQEVITESQEKVEKLMQKEIIVTEEEARAPKEGSTAMEPEVNTRVIATCQQLDPANSSKISAREALDIFNTLEVTTIDLDYIVSHCYDLVEGGKGNSLVRKWAVTKLSSMSGDNGIIKTSDGPKAKRTRIKQSAEA